MPESRGCWPGLACSAEAGPAAAAAAAAEEEEGGSWLAGVMPRLPGEEGVAATVGVEEVTAEEEDT